MVPHSLEPVFIEPTRTCQQQNENIFPVRGSECGNRELVDAEMTGKLGGHASASKRGLVYLISELPQRPEFTAS
jgi:hypothetical protein